jgi:hypothetical protein
MTARDWLKTNGYADVADLIDEVMAEIETSGSKQRRNWWDTLAGGKDGEPTSVNGHEFPVLRVAQIRQGKRITVNAICRNEAEQPPDVIATKRWPSRKPSSRPRRSATNPDHGRQHRST